jgi:ribosomal protein S12
MGFLNDLRGKSLEKCRGIAKQKGGSRPKKPASALHILFKKCRKMQNDCPKAVV